MDQLNAARTCSSTPRSPQRPWTPLHTVPTPPTTSPEKVKQTPPNTYMQLCIHGGPDPAQTEVRDRTQPIRVSPTRPPSAGGPCHAVAFLSPGTATITLSRPTTPASTSRARPPLVPCPAVPDLPGVLDPARPPVAGKHFCVFTSLSLPCVMPACVFTSLSLPCVIPACAYTTACVCRILSCTALTVQCV